MKTIWLGLALGFTLTSCLAAGGLYLVKIQPEHLISKRIIQHVVRWPKFRQAIQLNRVGDAQYQFSNLDTPLSVSLHYSINQTPGNQVDEWITSMIGDTIQKPAVIKHMPNSHWLLNTEYDQEELMTVLKNLRAESPSPADLDIVYVKRYQEEPTNIGLVVESNSIFIFTDVLQDLTPHDHIRDRLEKSTLMHEWGHLIGLEHVEKDGCIMSAKVEVYALKKEQDDNIPTQFCFEDLSQLMRLD